MSEGRTFDLGAFGPRFAGHSGLMSWVERPYSVRERVFCVVKVDPCRLGAAGVYTIEFANDADHAAFRGMVNEFTPALNRLRSVGRPNQLS